MLPAGGGGFSLQGPLEIEALRNKIVDGVEGDRGAIALLLVSCSSMICFWRLLIVAWEFWIRIAGDRMHGGMECNAHGSGSQSARGDETKGNARIVGNGNGRILIRAVVGDAST